MSQAQATEKDKQQDQQPLISNPEDFSCEVKRTGLFLNLLLGRAGPMVKVNICALLFATPLFAIYYIFNLAASAVGVYVPKSWNFGYIPNPAVMGAEAAARDMLFINSVQMYAWMTLGVLAACAGLAGAFYVMRTLARGQVIPVVKNYFVGVKKYALPFLILSPLFAGLFFLLAVSFTGFSSIAGPLLPVPAAVILLILVCVLALALLTIALFFFTLTVTFQMPLKTRLKNSLTFTIKYLPRNLIVLTLSGLPLLLMVLMSGIALVSFVVLFLVILFAVSFIVLLWTVYAHWVFHQEFETQATVENVTEQKRKTAALAAGQPAKKPASPVGAAQKQKDARPTASEAGFQSDRETEAAQKPKAENQVAPKDAQKPQHDPSAQKKNAAFKFKTKK
ncbi:MAG: hypothetical protein FWD58_00030 [Firmicutes bacterium]|nr:hypothetical protein [Bacillota bacterium]